MIVSAFGTQASGTQIVDLRQLSARDLEPLLREEIVEFRDQLDWDFTRSANLVRNQVEARNAGGAALIDGGEVAGYGCIALTGNKGLIWDLYIRPAWRGPACCDGNAETFLFRILFDAFTRTPAVDRIESQLMLGAKLPPAGGSVERLLMRSDLAAAPLVPNHPQFRIASWEDRHLEAAAGVLAESYAGHIDSRISDEYRTTEAARLHASNIVTFPGSSVFCPAASLIAFDAGIAFDASQPVGLVMASFVAADVGHIAHICVTPRSRRTGLGAELLSRSLDALRRQGAKRVSLTVTAANESAVRLYQRFGFRTIRRFPAWAWERTLGNKAAKQV